jgi:hypothetical protein
MSSSSSSSHDETVEEAGEPETEIEELEPIAADDVSQVLPPDEDESLEVPTSHNGVMITVHRIISRE